MKYLHFGMILVIVLFFQTVSAQQSQKILEPEYIGVFFYLNEGKLVALERQSAESKLKIKAMGFGGGESILQIKGEQSNVRFKADQKVEFVVRVSSQSTDPVSIIQFYRFESKKGMRRLSIAKAGTMGMGAKSIVNQNAVSFNAAKYGESSFKIVPANALLPGEYCFSGAASQDGFCFGIDVASTNK